MRSSPSRVPVFALLSLIAVQGCARKLEGPTPSVSGVSPAAVCTAQHVTAVEISGAGLAPLVTGALSDARLELPAVSLRRVQDLSGAAAPGEPVAIPDDPADPEASRVRWLSQERMSFDVFPELALSTGLHDVLVRNANGAEASFAASLLAVPPPVLASTTPDLVCGDEDATLLLAGQHFVRSDAALPTVLAGAVALDVAAMGACSPLPGTAGLSQCGEITAAIPAGRLAPGVHALSVTNPPPVGCTSTEAVTLTAVSRPVVSSFSPATACGAANVTLALEGSGFLVVDGTGPTLRLAGAGGAVDLAATASGCTGVVGPAAAVQSCTTLTATLAAGTLLPGDYLASVRNPAPAGCTATETFPVTVVADPVLASVEPAAVCSGDAVLLLSGSGFAAGARVTLGAVAATSVDVSVDGTSAVAVFPAPLPTGGPYDVTITNAAACEDTRAAATAVVAGPQLFFVDPSVVYNGISVQATVYGTGFTAPVAGVWLVPADGSAEIALAYTHDPARPNQVQVVIPLGTAPGSYGVRLDDGTDCDAYLAAAVTVTDQLTLALASPPVSPAFGWTGSSTAVSVFAASGDAFSPVPRVYLNPSSASPGALASAVGAVALVEPGRLAALVPAGLPVGLYDLIVVNPDGRVAVSTGAFEVMASPPPFIATISPGSLPNTGSQSFQILGSDFRAPSVMLACFDSTGAMIATAPAATVTAWSGSTIDVTLDDASLGGAGCIVRATNGDDGTFADFSALVFTNPALNLYPAVAGPDLGVPRRAPIVLGGDATPTARFLHVAGGDDGATVLGSVETSALTLVGAPAPFQVQRQGLVEPRTLAAGARIGRFLYVAGGSSAAGGGAPLASVERAFVLDPADRGEITDLLLEVPESGGVGPGLYYYRVAAVMDAADAFNPGGENLASDPFPVRIPDLGERGVAVTVQWAAVPGAASYRVYRSLVPDDAVGTETVIAEVSAPTTSFTDAGIVAPVAEGSPLPMGSTGRWHTLAARLSVAREGAAVAWGRDPVDATRAYLYVLGGRTGTESPAALASYEYLPLTLGADGSQTPDAGGFVAGARLLTAARWQLSAAPATNELSSRILSGSTYVYVLSGVDAAGTTVVKNDEAGLVSAGGDLGTFTRITASGVNAAGYVCTVAANLVFAFGGVGGSPSDQIQSAEICGAGSGCAPGRTAPEVNNWNTGQAMLVPRYLHGGVLHGAYIYVAGGLTGAATPATSTEYRIW